MKDRLSHFWPFLCIAVVWLLFASPYFVKGLVPFPSKYLVTFFPPWNAAFAMPVKNNAMPDIITQIYPWKKLTIDTWKSGNIPLWNPYSFSGTTHAANYQTAVFSPFNLLFFILPEIDAWSILVLLQPLLAGIFLYLFLRSIDRSIYASIVSSISFMFCGFLVVWMAYATLGYAVLWLPLILFGINNQLRKSSWWNLPLISISVSLSLLSGHFQMSLYVLFFSFVYLLFVSITTKKWKTGVLLFLFIVLGILISFTQLLPSYEAYRQSIRESSSGSGEIIPWQYLITLIAPDYFGNPVTRNDWFGHYAEWASYIGVIPLLAVFYVVLQKKSKYEWFFIVSALVAIFLAVNTPLSSLIYLSRFPVLSTSAASRIIVLFSFSLTILASFGFDRLIYDWRNQNIKYIKLLIVTSAVLLSLVWIGLLSGKFLSGDHLIVAKRNFLMPTSLVLIGSILFLAGYYMRKYSLLTIQIILVIVVFDMLRYATKWIPFDPREYIFPKTPMIAYLQQQTKTSTRVFGNFGNELGSYFSIPSTEGYDALYQMRYGQFISSATDGSVGGLGRSLLLIDKYGVYTEDILQLLGVRYLVYRLSDGRNVWTYPHWNYPWYKSIYRDSHYEIFENEHVYPRAFLVSSYKISKDNKNMMNQLFSSDFNRRDVILLEKQPLIEPTMGNGSVEIREYTPNQVSLRVQTTVPKLLYLSDVYDDGWRAWIGKSTTPIYRANFDFRAIAIPAGNYTVRFTYDPNSVRIGLIIAIGVIIFLSIGTLVMAYTYDNRHL